MRERLKRIYIDTLERFDNIETSSVTTKHTTREAFLILDGIKPDISVINTDTVSAGLMYNSEGRTCLLNMASWRRPGGGVANGAMAQEECLFRCSNLFEIPRDMYPLKVNEAIYTRDAVFIKDANYNLIPPTKMDVVTVPALNISGGKPDDYEKIMFGKIRLMLSLASKNDCKNIILGAWGCGVYGNDPIEVAKLFKEYIGNFSEKKNVVFAIINDHNSVGSNYEVFRKILA